MTLHPARAGCSDTSFGEKPGHFTQKPLPLRIAMLTGPREVVHGERESFIGEY